MMSMACTGVSREEGRGLDEQFRAPNINESICFYTKNVGITL